MKRLLHRGIIIGTLMDNKFIPKKVWITRTPSLKNHRDPLT